MGVFGNNVREAWAFLYGRMTRAERCEAAERERDEARAEVERLREALERITRFPCQHPDDPDEFEKMALDLCAAQDVAHGALDQPEETREERFRVALVEIEAEDSQPDHVRTTGRCAKIAREALDTEPPPPAQGEARFGRVHGGEKSDGTCTCPECRGGMKVETVPDPPAQEGRVWLCAEHGRQKPRRGDPICPECFGDLEAYVPESALREAQARGEEWAEKGEKLLRESEEAEVRAYERRDEVLQKLRESEERANTFELVLSDLEQYSEKLEARVARLTSAIHWHAEHEPRRSAEDQRLYLECDALADQPESARACPDCGVPMREGYCEPCAHAEEGADQPEETR